MGSARYSQTQLASELGISTERVRQLKVQGMPTDSLAAAQAWREQRQNVAQRKPAPAPAADATPPRTPLRWGPFDDARDPYSRPPVDAFPGADVPPLGEDRDEARTRREIAEANMAELAEARQRREVISVAAVTRQIATDFATTRDALLQLPARMGPILAAKSDAAEVQTLLEAEIHNALTRLAGCADAVPLIEGAFE
jgi:hypothetical protein